MGGRRMTRVIKAVSLPLGSPALQWVLNIEAQGGNFSKEMRRMIENHSTIYDQFIAIERYNRALKMQLLHHEKKLATTGLEMHKILEKIKSLEVDIKNN